MITATAAVPADTRVCARCGTSLVPCPAVPGWWVDAVPGPGRGECPGSASGHQAWPAGTLEAVRRGHPGQRARAPRQLSLFDAEAS